MNKKIIGIFCCMLVINAILPVVNTMEINKTYEIKSMSLSMLSSIDFIEYASDATWETGPNGGIIPFGGSTSDSSGFVCYRDDIDLEDGVIYERVLETHPKWLDNGYINGTYPHMMVAIDTELFVKVGFIEGATGSDGVEFKIFFKEYSSNELQLLLNINADYDGHLDEIKAPLNHIYGKTGNFILHVYAGLKSGQDWAVWVKAGIKSTLEPQEQWNKTIRVGGGSFGTSIQQTKDSGFIISGHYMPHETSYEQDACLIKTDKNGIVEWIKNWNLSNYDYFLSVKQTSDEGYITTGWNFAEDGCWVVKTDKNGDEEWLRYFGREGYTDGTCVIQTSDNNYVIVGASSSQGNSDMYIVKIDENGNKIWDQVFGYENMDRALSVCECEDEGYIMAGQRDMDSNVKAWIVKVDQDGNKQWDKSFGSSEYLEGFSSICKTDDGCYIVSGAKSYYEVNRYSEALLIKLDSMGNKIWEKTYGGEPFADAFTSVKQTFDGGYIALGIAGRNRNLNSDEWDGNLWLLKTDFNGNIVWEMKFGNDDKEDWPGELDLTDDNGCIITGYTTSYSTDFDLWLIKVLFPNHAPNNPTSRYEKDSNELVISTIDVDGNRVRFGVSWDNNEDTDEWTEYVNSGEEFRLDCKGRKGTAGVIAEDEFGAQSDWVSVTSKSKVIEYLFLNWLFNRFINRFPLFEKILNLTIPQNILYKII